ncbi:MAG: hypothetical protein RIQ60_3171 [Pseudomonadota bacterium]|jgi:CheY-like chemotaxis protein
MSLLKILLIDDDPISTLIAGKMLADQGQVRYAHSGAHGLDMARQWQPDVVLLDAEMPDMDGYETCRLLKADPTLVEVPVIFLSRHSSAERRAEALAAGAADTLIKPATGPQITQCIQRHIRARLLAGQARTQVQVSSAGADHELHAVNLPSVEHPHYDDLARSLGLVFRAQHRAVDSLSDGGQDTPRLTLVWLFDQVNDGLQVITRCNKAATAGRGLAVALVPAGLVQVELLALDAGADDVWGVPCSLSLMLRRARLLGIVTPT